MKPHINVLHIAPALPPTVNGVGDYAAIIALKIKEISQDAFTNIILVANRISSADQITKMTDYRPVYFSGAPSASQMLKIVNKNSPDVILLHYVGYGYARRGAPWWLLRALILVRKKQPHIRIVTMFHELYATGKLWQSSFWLSPLQRYIVSRIVQLSDCWMTNRHDSAVWLKQYASEKPHAVLPIFSNIGEAKFFACNRLPKVVIFGTSGLRTNTYLGLGQKLFDWALCEGLEVHDIGPPIHNESIQESIKKNGVIEHGMLEASKIEDIFQRSTFGLISYPVHVLGKSGVFAAYTANGLCSIVLSEFYPVSDKLVCGEHYLSELPSNGQQMISPADIGSKSWLWYQQHSSDSHARAFIEFVALKT